MRQNQTANNMASITTMSMSDRR